ARSGWWSWLKSPTDTVVGEAPTAIGVDGPRVPSPRPLSTETVPSPGVGRHHVEPAVAVSVDRDHRPRLRTNRVVRNRTVEGDVGVRWQRGEHQGSHDGSDNDDASRRRPHALQPEHLRLLRGPPPPPATGLANCTLFG